MGFIAQLRKEKMEAMKSKDSLRGGLISLLLSALTLKEKEEQRELTQAEEFQIVQRELKQTKETLDTTPVDRVALIEETKKKIEILESYLPKQLSKEELVKEIQIIMEELNLEATNQNRGTLTKEVLSKFAGRTDGKSVNIVLQELLS